MTKRLKTVFAGTPEFASPYLAGLLTDPAFLVIGVLTQPDRPSGRKQQLSPSPIKVLAEKNNIQVWQPEKLRKNEEILEEIKTLKPDLLVVVAYGQIIPAALLDLFPAGCINVHPSLLPKYRGASPIQSALLNGETETGITIMLMDEQMDHGPILAQQKVALTGEETNESLHRQLAEFGVDLLKQTISDYTDGNITPQPQIDDQATYCSPIAKEDGRIDWQDSAQTIKQKIYAFHPWPGTWTSLNGQRLKIFPPVSLITTDIPSEKAGKLIEYREEITVICGSNALILDKIQPEGKKPMSAKDFWRGLKDKKDIIFV